MKRNYAVLLLLIALVLAVPARGQSGMCPDNVNEIGPMPGAWPGTMAHCDSGTGDSVTIYDDALPCGGAVETRRAFVGEQPGYIVVPPANMEFPSGYATVSFYAHVVDILGNPTDDDFRLITKSYDSSRRLIASGSWSSGGAQLIIGTEPFYKFPRSALVPTNVAMVQGGYLHISVDSVPSWAGAFRIMSLRIADGNGAFPALCDLPGALPTPTPTNTPIPTDTPEPTATQPGDPSPTPVTPSPTPSNTPTIPSGWPTATPPTETPTPRPTNTPRPLNTLPPRATPTPLTVVTMPALIVPTIEWPEIGGMATGDASLIDADLTPNATYVARADSIATQTARGHLMVTRWYTTTQQSLGYLGTEITSTSGISTPVEMAATFTSQLTVPVSYFRAIRQYMPNLWPLLLTLFLVSAWMLFIIIAKFGIAVVSEIIEFLRKVWEAIPLN